MTTQFIAVRVDDENNAETWWDAVRETYPTFAESLARNGGAVIAAPLWDDLAALPGFADGPAHVETALIDCGGEGQRWADVTAGKHGVFEELS